MFVTISWAAHRLCLDLVYPSVYEDGYWGTKTRGGDDLLFSVQNLQDSSDCAKNRAPDKSWLAIDVRNLVWSKSRSELGDRVHQSWRLEFPYINYNGKIVSKSTSNSGFRGPSQLWCTVSPSSDGLFDQTQILSSITTHELSGARFLAQSEQSCKFWDENKRLSPPQVNYEITILIYTRAFDKFSPSAKNSIYTHTYIY